MSMSENKVTKPPGLQTPRDIAVVMPTILRPSLLRAVESVYAQDFVQDFGGTIQLLIGVDAVKGDPAILETLRATCPDQITLTVLNPGYSTVRANGGLHPARDGGAMRTMLSYLANARYIAYLDDDNWWGPDHLSSLFRTIQGVEGQGVQSIGWAYSFRWYVDPDNFATLCLDQWESVGPDRGVYAEKAGGFVDPNCLMIDKILCEPVLRWWSVPMFDARGDGADRNVFNALKADYSWAETRRATTYYVIGPGDSMDPHRQKWIAEYLAANPNPPNS